MAAIALYIDLLNEQQCPCKLKNLEAKMEDLANQNKILEEQLAECRSGNSAIDTSELESRIALLEQEKIDLQNELNRVSELKREAEMNLASAQASLEECQANSSDGKTLPTFNVSSRGNYTVIEVSSITNTVVNSEGEVKFEFDANMQPYAEAGYKVYGVIKDNGATFYEALLPDADQNTALGSSDMQYSEIANGWLQSIVGKTPNSTNLTAHVYLMNEAGNKVYPANQPDGFVGALEVRMKVELAQD